MPEEVEVFAISKFFNEWINTLSDEENKNLTTISMFDEKAAAFIEQKVSAHMKLYQSIPKGKQLFLTFKNEEHTLTIAVAIHFMLHGRLKILNSKKELQDIISIYSPCHIKCIIELNSHCIVLFDNHEESYAKAQYITSEQALKDDMAKLAPPFWNTKECLDESWKRWVQLRGDRNIEACLKEQLVAKKAIFCGIGKRILNLILKEIYAVSGHQSKSKAKELTKSNFQSVLAIVRSKLDQQMSALEQKFIKLNLQVTERIEKVY